MRQVVPPERRHQNIHSKLLSITVPTSSLSLFLAASLCCRINAKRWYLLEYLREAITNVCTYRPQRCMVHGYHLTCNQAEAITFNLPNALDIDLLAADLSTLVALAQVRATNLSESVSCTHFTHITWYPHDLVPSWPGALMTWLVIIPRERCKVGQTQVRSTLQLPTARGLQRAATLEKYTVVCGC